MKQMSLLIMLLGALPLACINSEASLDQLSPESTTSPADDGLEGEPLTRSFASPDAGVAHPSSPSDPAPSPSPSEPTPAPTPVEHKVPVIAGCKVFPPDSPWNKDISGHALSPRSWDYIQAMGPSVGLYAGFGAPKNDGLARGIPFILVRGDQQRYPVSFNYASESDPGPYPIPLDAPIQQPASASDRHVLALDTWNCVLYELFDAHPSTDSWWAGSGAIWHLNANERRPDKWTSADASGLPILPGLIRYEEVEAGEILHAVRMTVSSAQKAYIYPATHSDGQAGADPAHPPMGARARLKANFDISGFSWRQQVILKALKKYGTIVADTGNDWTICGAPDDRWDNAMLQGLSAVKGSDFEVVDTGEVHSY